MSRYDRQIRLEQVGPEGQARISRARAEVRGRDGNLVELSYVERAGFREVALRPDLSPAPFIHERWFRFEESRQVGAGAWRALVQIRRALGAAGP